MKKIKIMTIYSHSVNSDYSLPEGVRKDITDWTEVSDEYFDFLISNKYNIEQSLKSKNIIDYSEELIFLRQLSDEDYKDAFEIMNEEYEEYKQKVEKDRIKREKEKARREKQKQENKEKQKEKELQQLRRLKEKYE